MVHRKITPDNIPDDKIYLNGRRGREFLRGIINKHGTNMSVVFDREDVPEGFNYAKYTSYIHNSNIKAMRKDWHQWLVKAIREEKRTRKKIDSFELIANQAVLYALTENPNFPAMPFNAKGGKIIGYAVPAHRLAAFFNAQAAIHKQTTISFMGKRDSYAAFKNPEYSPPTEDELSARLIVLGARTQGDTRILPIVSPALYQAMMKHDFNVAEETPPVPQTEITIIAPIIKELYYNTGDIRKRCDDGKAVYVTGANIDMVAVPVSIAKELQEKFFSTLEIYDLTATNLHHGNFDRDVLRKRTGLYIVTRGSGYQGQERSNVFALIPFSYINLLDRDSEGKITGLKEKPEVHISFNAAAQIKVVDGRAEIHIDKPKQDKDGQRLIEMLRTSLKHLDYDTTEPYPEPTRPRLSLSTDTAHVSGVLNARDGSFSGLRVNFNPGSWQNIALSLAPKIIVHIGGQKVALRSTPA